MAAFIRETGLDIWTETNDEEEEVHGIYLTPVWSLNNWIRNCQELQLSTVTFIQMVNVIGSSMNEELNKNYHHAKFDIDDNI